MNDRMNQFSIELDCAPGSPRPDDLIGGVLKGTRLKLSDFSTGNPFFGNQMWVLKETAGKDELFAKAKPVLKERVEALYHSGAIRYGSW